MIKTEGSFKGDHHASIVALDYNLYNCSILHVEENLEKREDSVDQGRGPTCAIIASYHQGTSVRFILRQNQIDTE